MINDEIAVGLFQPIRRHDGWAVINMASGEIATLAGETQEQLPETTACAVSNGLNGMRQYRRPVTAR